MVIICDIKVVKAPPVFMKKYSYILYSTNRGNCVELGLVLWSWNYVIIAVLLITKFTVLKTMTQQSTCNFYKFLNLGLSDRV